MGKLTKYDEAFLQNLCPTVREDVRKWPIPYQAHFLHHLQKTNKKTLESLSFSSPPPSLSPDSIISIHSSHSKKKSPSPAVSIRSSHSNASSTHSKKQQKKDKCPKGTRRNKQGICVETKERCPKGQRRNKKGDCVDVKKKEAEI